MLENLLPHPWFFTAFLFSWLLRTDYFPPCYFLKEDYVRANSSFPAWPWKPQIANLVVDQLPLDKLSLGKPTLVLPISQFCQVACWSKAVGGRKLSVNRWMGQADPKICLVKSEYYQGAWVVHLIGCPAFYFGWSYDLRVMGCSLVLGSARSRESTWDFLPLSQRHPTTLPVCARRWTLSDE